MKVVYDMMQMAPEAYKNNILPWFLMPAKLTSLAKHPWTFITYMFTNIGVITTLTNMLWLWAFGSILQNIAGNKKIFPVYIYGGVAGAVAFIAANYFIPSLKPLLPFHRLDHKPRPPRE